MVYLQNTSNVSVSTKYLVLSKQQESIITIQIEYPLSKVLQTRNVSDFEIFT